jgi:DNA-binding transcriptional LysR family regulator
MEADMNNINHLRYFLTVCKLKSFTGASEVLHVSQPAITAAIKELERELGFRLFDRINNRISITAKGLRLFFMTERLLDTFDNFYSEAIDFGSNRSSAVRIGVPAILSTFFLKKFVPGFRQKNPNIQLEIFEVPTFTGLDMIDKAALDLTIGVIDGRSSAYGHERIFDTDLVLFLNADNPLAKESRISMEMLTKQPFIMVPKGSAQYNLIISKFSSLPPDIVLHSTQISTIRYMLQNDLAVMILYKQVFEDDESICSRPLQEPLSAKIGVFWKKGIYITSAMKRFISFIRAIGV